MVVLLAGLSLSVKIGIWWALYLFFFFSIKAPPSVKILSTHQIIQPSPFSLVAGQVSHKHVVVSNTFIQSSCFIVGILDHNYVELVLLTVHKSIGVDHKNIVSLINPHTQLLLRFKNMEQASKVLNILQINLNRSKEATDVIEVDGVDIFIVQEPNANNGKVYGFNKYEFNCFYYMAPKQRPRATICVRKTIKAKLIPELTSSDFVTVEAQYKDTDKERKILLCSVYLDITMSVKSQTLIKILEFAELYRYPLLMGMDSNAHNGIWNSQTTNARGEALEEVINLFNLQIANSGSLPTFESHVGTSIIDLTLFNLELLHLGLDINNWLVDNDTYSFSDHKYIRYNIGNYSPILQFKRNIRNVDWALFRTVLEQKYKRAGSRAEEIEQSIISTLNEMKTLRKSKSKKVWNLWTGELQAEKVKLRKLYKKSKNNSTLLGEYWQKMQDFRYKIRKFKSNKWKEFCTKLEGTQDVAKIIKTLKPNLTPAPTCFTTQDQDGLLKITNPLTELANIHFPNHLQVSDEGEVQSQTRFGGVQDMELLNFINVENIKLAFESFKPFKSAGMDEIQPKVLTELPIGMLENITCAYRESVESGVVPYPWTQMKVCFIPKVGKESYNNPKAYRPITLSSYILKGLERILQWFITNKIQQPLYNQHAYCLGYSCETAISEVVTYIEKGLHEKLDVVAVSLDCSGAFDNIKFTSACNAMQQHALPEQLILWYKNLLQNRTLTLEFGNETSQIKPTVGSPQGGILSPIVWNLILNELLVKFKRGPVTAIAYADDVILLSKGIHNNTVVDNINEKLKLVQEWGQDHGLTFNPTKTQAICFTRKRKLEWKSIQMGGKKVEYQPTIKYLGITIDKNLSWGPHIKDRCSKAKITLYAAKAAIGSKWGLGPKQILWIYTALVRPVISYGSIVWSHKLNKIQLMALEKVQRIALLNISSSMRSTPTKAIETVLNVLPIDLFLQQGAVKSRHRIRGLQTNNAWMGIDTSKYSIPHRKFLDEKIHSISPFNTPSTVCRKHRIWNVKPISVDKCLHKLSYIIYTDGSKNEKDNVGGGFLITQDNYILHEHTFKLQSYNSVFQSEVMAIKEALTWIKDNNLHPVGNFSIYSDSQSAVTSLKGYNFKDSLTSATKKLLVSLQEQTIIDIQWTRAHVGNTGNEIADMLAKRGSKQGTLKKVGYPLSYFNHKLHDTYIQYWQTEWNSLPICKHAKSMLPKVGIKEARNLINYRRSDINLVIQIVSGHALLSKHLANWNELQAACRLCLEGDETPLHLLTECPALTEERDSYYTLSNNEKQFTWKRLLSFFQNPKVFWLFYITEREEGSVTS